jgi:hypothetical protein
MKRRRSGKRKKGRRSVKISNGSLSSWKRKRTRGLIPQATGKRKREADAEVTEEAEGVELGGSGIENGEKEKEKKRRRISDAVWKTMSRNQRKHYMQRRNR